MTELHATIPDWAIIAGFAWWAIGLFIKARLAYWTGQVEKRKRELQDQRKRACQFCKYWPCTCTQVNF